MYTKVILLETVRNLGKLGEVVRVRSGYSRNFLIPQGKAVKATKDNLVLFETRRAELEKKASELLSEAKKRADQLKNFSVTIYRKALEEGKLFGSVGIKDIVDAIQAKGVQLQKSEVNLPNGPVRSIGEYDVSVLLHSDVAVTIKLNVLPEQQ